MAYLDAHLYQQLTAPALWAAPHPLLPLTRLQTTLHLHDGHDVADWLYAQGTQLACTRVAQWLSTLAEAARDEHETVHAPLVRAFQERAFRHLWAFLEQEFSSHVLPLLATTETNESVALAHAAASWLRILDVVALPRLAASAAWWAWLQEIVPLPGRSGVGAAGSGARAVSGPLIPRSGAAPSHAVASDAVARRAPGQRAGGLARHAHGSGMGTVWRARALCRIGAWDGVRCVGLRARGRTWTRVPSRAAHA